FQADYVIKILVIEFGAYRADTGVDFVVANQRSLKIEFLRSKCQTATVTVSVRCSSQSKQPCVFFLAQMRRHRSARCGEFEPIIRFTGTVEIVSRAPLG